MAVPELKIRKSRRGAAMIVFLLRGKENLIVKWALADSSPTLVKATPDSILQWLQAQPASSFFTVVWERRYPHPKGGQVAIRSASRINSQAAAILLDVARHIVMSITGPDDKASRRLGRDYFGATIKAVQGKTERLTRIGRALGMHTGDTTP
jgi:hypothetical protein